MTKCRVVLDTLNFDDDNIQREEQLDFENVWCSSCGEEFGPGGKNFSHCVDHDDLEPIEC